MRRHSQTDPELAAIEIVYRERLKSFVRLATAITGNEHGALDAVHDGFVRAVRHRHQLRDRKSAPGWVCRIVLNEARKRATAEGRYVPAEGEAADRVAAGPMACFGRTALSWRSTPRTRRRRSTSPAPSSRTRAEPKRRP